MLDREQLEDILLNPPRVEVHPLQCSDSITLDCLPTGPAERPTRIRHVLAAAHELLVRSANTALVGRCLLDSPTLVKNYFKVHFAGAERETFVVVFLDSQMRVIATEELFAGTLQQTSVYPREVVKRALHHNAGGVIFGHPHPSGQCEPSRADEFLTQTLKSALSLVDVRVLDHMVVSGSTCTSFAERGLL
ncbi:MAG: JAB domain-containing protein [Rhodococcus sp. (in: high G+C Gram-positive bacteria)]